MADAPSDGVPVSPPLPDESVQIQLGPHDIYSDIPEPAPEPEPDDDQGDDDEQTPEPDDGPPTLAEPRPDAGPPSAPQPEGKKSRRQRGEEAYQRGLSAGRVAAQQEWQQQQHQQLVEQAQRDANQRIEQLFQQLQAPTFQAREEAGKQLAAIHQQTLQGTQALEVARQQVYTQMAADFATVRDLPNASEQDLKDLQAATSMSDFASKVHAIGRRGEDQLNARITKLEAELQAARAHAVGARATPEAANGAGRIGQIAMHDLNGMPLKDIRKLEGTPEYDRMVAQFLSDKAAGRI